MTPRQREVYDFIAGWIIAKGYVPDYSEMLAGLPIKSRNTLHRQITALVRQGFIKRDDCRRRGLTIVKPDSVKLHPEIMHLTDDYAKAHGISRETAVNEALRQWLGAA